MWSAACANVSFTRFGNKRREADAARGIAAGVLKIADLLGEFRLAGTRGGGVQRENVIQNARDDLQPVAFGAAKFFDFKPERALLGVVELDLKFIELADLRGCALGNFVRRRNGLFSAVLRDFLDARTLDRKS